MKLYLIYEQEYRNEYPIAIAKNIETVIDYLKAQDLQDTCCSGNIWKHTNEVLAEQKILDYTFLPKHGTPMIVKVWETID